MDRWKTTLSSSNACKQVLYCSAALSVHPNGKRYEWNGKDPQTITRQEVDEFIRLVNPSMQSRPHQQEQRDDSPLVGEGTRSLTTRGAGASYVA